MHHNKPTNFINIILYSLSYIICLQNAHLLQKRIFRYILAIVRHHKKAYKNRKRFFEIFLIIILIEYKEKPPMIKPSLFLQSLPQADNEVLNALLGKISESDRIWLSGYLYGLSPQSPISQTTGDTPDQNIAVLYASQSGNAKKVAEKTVAFLAEHYITATALNVAKVKIKKLGGFSTILGVIATYGEGEPPDDAIAFFDELLQKKSLKLNNVKISTLALGDSSYEHFCKTGHDFQQAFIACGASPFDAVFEADLDFEPIVKKWHTHLLENLEATENTSLLQPILATSHQNTAKYDRNNPFTAKILRNQKITAAQSLLDIRHVEIDIEGSGITYHAGDDLGIWFTNNVHLVNEIITQIQAKPDDKILLNDEELTLNDALTQKLEITAATAKFVTNYAKLSGAKKLAPYLKDKTALREYANQTQIIDVLKTQDMAIKAQDFALMLRPLTPRLYSIASAPSDSDDEVHLTIKIVNFSHNQQQRFGGASGYIGCLKDDDAVQIYIENNDKFRLPEDDKDIIMIGNSTGIAPFRAFMYERQNNNAQGKNWLIYNNPSFEHDFLYQSEWVDWQKNRLLSDYNFIWHEDEKQIKELMLQHATKIWQWLEDGAFLYIAGSQTTMAKAAHEALLQIAQQQGGLDDKQSRTWMNELKSQNRYQRDIY